MLCAAALACAASGAAAQTLALPLDDAWEARAEGAWRVAIDGRHLAAMRHPDAPSARGGYALLQRAARVPETWQGPVDLVVYCADDHHGVPPPGCPPGIAATVLPGRRFKQVLVDAAVVWNADVADPVAPGTPAPVRVRIPVAPGQTFQIGLMVYDAEGVDPPRPGDAHCPPRAADAPPPGFPTAVYWGDAQLVAGEAAPVPGARPAEALVARRHAARWPTPPEAAARFEGDGTVFRLDAPEIPKPGFPVRAGIPLPPGRVRAAADFRLRGPGGAALAARKTPLGRWPDDSWQWALIEFTAAPGMDSVALRFERDPARPPAVGRAAWNNGEVEVRAGELRMSAGAGDPVRAIALRGNPMLGALSLALETGGTLAPGTAEEPSVVAGDLAGPLVWGGGFDGPRAAQGRFTLSVAPHGDLPILRVDVALVNDTGAPLPVQGLTLEFALPAPPARAAHAGEALPASGSLFQADARRLLLDGAPRAVPPGPQAFTLDKVSLALPDFRERHPKRIAWDADALRIDLCAAPDQPVILPPGDRMAHTLWIGFGLEDPAAFARCAQFSPLPVNRDYALATGAWGALPALPDSHPLLRALAAHAGLEAGAPALGDGVRHHPAQPHFAGPGHWANNFTERLHGLWVAWALTGDRRWHDRARAFGAHLLDVALPQAGAPGFPPGAMRGPGPDHGGPAWPPAQRSTGLESAWRHTGEEAYRAAADRLAAHCAGDAPGRDSPGARHHAAPLETLGNAYAATGDPALLDAAAPAIDAIWARIDRRRGAWPEAHASWSARATDPWHAAQLARALLRWYGETGDIEAAQAVAALADAARWEGGLEADGPRTIGALALLAMAHDLTGDAGHADTLRAGVARWLAAGAPVSPFDTLWMIEELGGWIAE